MQQPEYYERLVLAHRYLYYVLDDPLISDFEYDKLERIARELCEGSSPVHGVGSCLKTSYSPEVIKYAETLNESSY